MSSRPDVSEIFEHVETDLSAEALDRLIDDAEQEIIAQYGAHDSQVEEISLTCNTSMLFPTRPVVSVTSIVEIVSGTETTLATDDYALRGGGWMIERLNTGTNLKASWARRVRVDYVPVDDSARRKRVIIDLVRLALQYNALKSEVIGDYESTSENYQDARLSLMSALSSRQRPIV